MQSDRLSRESSCPKRRRLYYATAVLLVIAAGLASRGFEFSRALGKYPGDVLWGLMIFLGFEIVAPMTSTVRVSAYAGCFCFLIELSQLYHAAWIDGIRTTTLGHLVLGSGFMWRDLVSYATGIACGSLIETWWRRRLMLGYDRE
jgi:hypothetical protein